MKAVRNLFFVLLAGALLASPAMAGISGTPHSLSGLTVGGQSVEACAVCHIPHGGGERLWATSTPGSAYVGVVADLCATCHVGAGGYQGALAGAGYEPASDTYVYGAASHGSRMTIANLTSGTPVAPGNGLATSGLPYTGSPGKAAPVNGVMECTSCHDVHNNTAAKAPFLWEALEDICQKCHTNRHPAAWVNGAFGAWGSTRRATNPGSHPIGSDIIADTTGDLDANSPIVAVADLNGKLKMARGVTAGGSWSLGGHLSTGNAISCNTCHAVHGVQKDDDDLTSTGASAVPGEDFLAISQQTTTSEGYSSPIANGDGAYNTLCEACHHGGTAGDGGYWWNPGATANSHPVDLNVLSTANFSTSFLSNLPAGNIPAGAAPDPAPQPICESCHTPHIAAWKAAGLLTATRNADGGAFILRAQANLCEFCHNGTGTMTGHHPGGAAGVYGVSTSLGKSDGTTLGCGTCHAYSTASTGAIHNWTTPGRPTDLSLNPGWVPTNNAPRGSALTTGNLINANTSQICIDCHIALDQDANLYNVTKHSNTSNSRYENLGSGSHFLGASTAAFFAGGYIRGNQADPTFNATNEKWPNIDNGTVTTNGFYSRFDGSSATPIVVCESCHNLDPDVNTGYKLTVAYYREGDPYNQQYAPLCEGCHGWPTGTHPVTDNTVPTTGAVLKTTDLNAQPATGPTYGASGGSNPGYVSCDSCHQPHSAKGSSLIIDTSTAVTSGASAVIQTIGGRNVVDRRNKASENIPTYSAFCLECHNR